MPHINLPADLPGIRGAMAFRPETARPLNDLVDVLLHAPNSLTSGERELIATYVSSQNDCYYCQTIHGAVAAACLDGNEALVKQVKADFLHADISPKLKALLNIAGKVQKGGKQVTSSDIEQARAEGATDTEIHDAVLIAAAFCSSTATSTASTPGSPATRTCTASAASASPATATSPSAASTSPNPPPANPKEKHRAPHCSSRRSARNHKRLRLPPRDRKAHARTRPRPAPRPQHPHPRRTRAHRNLRLQP
ncbi:carboxymuconolactone decarboxylase family protein [Edaphobacter bradus]|uniref:carboxymuconolactone decarboxylase family protein n=1 Tax=Edaphobacter bradus TaxID=2259016 RepID=UPI0021E066A9|nr:peroxidase-related enzyme [Edaphobacter bradus]